MRIGIIAIGKAGRGPEAQLADDYVRRATAAGRALGLGPVELIDLDPKKPGKAPEAEMILTAAEGAHLIACDERGRTYGSRAFSDHIAGLRDQGERRLVFAIGGATGWTARCWTRHDRPWPSVHRPGPTPWPGRCWRSRSTGR